MRIRNSYFPYKYQKNSISKSHPPEGLETFKHRLKSIKGRIYKTMVLKQKTLTKTIDVSYQIEQFKRKIQVPVRDIGSIYVRCPAHVLLEVLLLVYSSHLYKVQI